MREKTFPIVDDNEPLLGTMPHMDLYEEADLISNIIGDYQDKNHLEWSPISDVLSSEAVKAQGTKMREAFKAKGQNHQGLQQEPIGKIRIDKSHLGERVGKESSRKVTKKRIPPHLTKDSLTAQAFGREQKKEQSTKKKKPTAPFQKEHPGEYARFSAPLRQTEYILADLKPHYQPMEDGKDKSQRPNKNNYDFLKKSQIYNQQDPKTPRERKIAQELNLTGLENK